MKTLLVGLTFLTLLVVMILGLSLAKWGREAAQSQSPDCSLYVNVTSQEDQGLANVLQDRPTGLRALCQGYLQSFALVQGMIVGAAVFSAVINVASGQLIARLAHFMQPPNWTALEATIMEMTFLVQLLTLGVVVTLVCPALERSDLLRHALHAVHAILHGLTCVFCMAFHGLTCC